MTYDQYKNQTVEQIVVAQVQAQAQMDAAKSAQLRALTEVKSAPKTSK